MNKHKKNTENRLFEKVRYELMSQSSTSALTSSRLKQNKLESEMKLQQ